MKIKKKLQKIFKLFFQKLFILIYGKVSLDTNFNFLNENSTNKLDKVIIDNFTYNIFKIKKARIYTDLVQNVAVILKNNLIPKASFQKINSHVKKEIDNVCLKKGTPRIKIKKNGKLLALIQDASENNFSHWLLDILPRLKIFEQNNSIKEIDYFLLPELKYSFHRETLEILNIPFNKILSDKQNRHIETDLLFVTDHPWHKKGNVQDEIIHIPEWIIKWLREKFLDHAECKNISEKIYIDRSDSLFNHCQIINSDEVWEFLKNEGFTKIKSTEITFKNQIGLFNSANTIVGAHGAGLTNMIFSKSDTNIIEFAPKNHPNNFFQRVSQINNLNYRKIVSKNLKLNNHNKRGDILVDLKILRESFENLKEFKSKTIA
jgi:capsular polysaccharide biosynthesis protein